MAPYTYPVKAEVPKERPRNKHYRIVTCNLPLDLINLMDEMVSEGWYLSRTELMRDALDSAIFEDLELLFHDELPLLKNEQVFENGNSLDLNMRNKSNKLSDLFGLPQGVYNGHIYELRYQNVINPGWVCIGRTDESDV